MLNTSTILFILKSLFSVFALVIINVLLSDLNVPSGEKIMLVGIFCLITVLWITLIVTPLHTFTYGCIMFALSFCTLVGYYEENVYDYQGKIFSPQKVHEQFAYRKINRYEFEKIEVNNPFSQTKIPEIVKHHLLSKPESAKRFLEHRMFEEPLKYLKKKSDGTLVLGELEKEFLDRVDPLILEGTFAEACRKAQTFSLYNKTAIKYALKKHFREHDICHELLNKDTGLAYDK